MAAEELAGEIGQTTEACEALGVARSTLYRKRQPATPEPKRRPRPHRALDETEREEVLGALHCERFVDKAPAQVWATLLDEGTYLCSIRTMYRILEEHGEVRERRNQRRHPNYTKPELLAEAPNQVWSWDITKLRGPVKWTYYYLYVILDIFSRYVVGWMLAHRESAALAQRLIAESCRKQDIERDQLTLHADRGSSMRSKPVGLLLSDLGVTKTHSRPYVSNDNPYSESQFKTMKYCPQFPSRFGSAEDGRLFCCGFFDYYNFHHRHSGIGLMTPADVHYGRAEQLTTARRQILLEAQRAHPERFVRGTPQPPVLPPQAWINPPLEKTTLHLMLKWTPFFRPGVKVVKQACSMKKGAEKSEEKSHEAQPCFQGESCLGGTTRAGDSGGTIPAAQGSREPDLQVEAAAFGERDACFRDRRGGRRRCLDARGRTAPENRGADDGARFFITRARSIAMTPRRELVEPNAPLSMRWQCELLGVNRSSLYYEPVEPDGEQLALMRRMDELHLKHPFFGSRMMTQTLKAEGSAVNRKRVQRLMRLMGLESTAPKPNTSKPAPEHTVYPYLLRNLTVSRINQVWAADITYIPMARGFVYLVAVIDWYSRRVLAWRLSNTLETTFCVEAVNEAVARYGRPAIFNTDQGSQFTSEEFTSVLLALEIKISMDGKGRCIDNIFVERLWRSLKYEEVYLYAYDTVQMARAGIACYFDFFNDERPHKALGYQTPASFYDGLLGEVA